MRVKTAVAAAPVPDRLTICGLGLALSAMFSEAVRAPDAVGLKITLIVQLAPAATVLPHVFVWEKSALLILMPVMASGTDPVFVNVTVWGWLAVPSG